MAMHCALFPMAEEKYITEVIEESKRFGAPSIVIAARRGLSQLIAHFWNDPHCSLDDKKWVIYDAFKHSNLSAMKALARIIDEKGNTILHWAAIYADPAILQILLEGYRLDMFSTNKAGQSPLRLTIVHLRRENNEYLMNKEFEFLDSL